MMKEKNSKVKKTTENLVNRTSDPSLIINEEVMLNNSNKNLETSPFSEDSDEEWLKAKHRLLDGRIKHRNHLKAIYNVNAT